MTLNMYEYLRHMCVIYFLPVAICRQTLLLKARLAPSRCLQITSGQIFGASMCGQDLCLKRLFSSLQLGLYQFTAPEQTEAINILMNYL